MEHRLRMRQQLDCSEFGNELFLNISGPPCYNMISYEYLSLWVNSEHTLLRISRALIDFVFSDLHLHYPSLHLKMNLPTSY